LGAALRRLELPWNLTFSFRYVVYQFEGPLKQFASIGVPKCLYTLLSVRLFYGSTTRSVSTINPLDYPFDAVNPSDTNSTNPLNPQIPSELQSLDQAGLEAMAGFLQILRRLRTDCPWDREQTHASLRAALIEEAYETIEAIDLAVDTGDYTELKKELGDLLLHILFHTELARESGHFTLEEVVRTESEKLIYRHPHVFADTKVEGAEEVSRNWEQLKRREKGRNSILDGVPLQLPALQRAARIQDKASKVGFDWTNSHSVWEKVREEIEEFEVELGKDEAHDRKMDEFGDLLFSLVNLARHEGLDPEQALRQATQKFDKRFRKVEQRVEATERPMKSFSLAELDAIWDQVKLEDN
jgi:MazG family protein